MYVWPDNIMNMDIFTKVKWAITEMYDYYEKLSGEK